MPAVETLGLWDFDPLGYLLTPLRFVRGCLFSFRGALNPVDPSVSCN